MPAELSGEDRERGMYGCTVTELHRWLDESGLERDRLAFNELSDAQEAMAMGGLEMARQTINRAKWLIGGGDRRGSRDPKPPSQGPLAGIEKRGTS